MTETEENGHTAVLAAVQRCVADPRMALMPPKHLSQRYKAEFFCNDTLLSGAIRKGQVETIDWLLSLPEIDPSACDGRALAVACESPCIASNFLVEQWSCAARLRGEKWTWAEKEAARARAQPLHIVGERARHAILEKLLADPRVDPSADDNAALSEAAGGPNRPAFFRLLRDPRVNPANPRRPAIVAAAGGGDVVILQHLLADPRVDPTAVTRLP